MVNKCWSQTFFRSLYAPDESRLATGIVKQNNDSFVIFLGRNYQGLTIAKLDTIGEVLTARELRFNTYSYYDHDFKAIITPDSSIVIMSSVYKRSFITTIFIAKLNKKAEPVWVKSVISSTAEDIGTSIKYTSDGGYIISGEKWIGTVNPAAAYLEKIDSNGHFQWAKIFNRNRGDAFL